MDDLDGLTCAVALLGLGVLGVLHTWLRRAARKAQAERELLERKNKE